MQLNKQLLSDEERRGVPEKVLQFGTGVLLRGLPDYFIDKANKAGIFNGRIVMIKSTDKGNTDAYQQQNNLYTHCIQGIMQGRRVEEYIVNAAIGRVLSAAAEWEEILTCATSPDMEIVISNTTEVGITLSDDNVHAAPPASFPGKLLAFLLRRYQHFKGDPDKGMVIIPTELIPDNGTKLKNILLELAKRNQLDEPFIQWLTTANHICNSLVDRIVPGALPQAAHTAVEEQLGYEDKLMIMSEPYALWAIETDNETVKKKLSFYQTDNGVVLAADINVFRELKLRLLNGTHTLTCGLAALAGFETVKDAMEDPAMESCISALMKHEIVPAITDMTIREDAALRFAGSVLDRFRNPYIEHRWLSITMQYTSKMKMRVIPVLQHHYQRFEEVPALMALGFAAYLLFMRDGNVTDDHAAYFKEKWQRLEPVVLVQTVLKDTWLWGTDLTAFTGFAHAVTVMLGALLTEGAISLIRRVSEETTIA
ncbi:tagaturonate reductase [Chitinophaga ginsengisoli]|uniref:Tagaturonate reductase n=1 Tax=Chitinophaga ginsengisoli TaxID=363837 RepID=A0A2P8FTA3_9BACT|nr:tagaturonate reductase [Chitinophaga ginsengisoli]PSL24956.1 tagaturonate reductase [Chitinophaga ginsengisoli]